MSVRASRSPNAIACSGLMYPGEPIGWPAWVSVRLPAALIARAISAAGSLTLTQAGQPIGSPGYMSPEQAMALGDLDARTDLYSLGCVLFEMLAGESPAASMTERRVHNWTALETSP